MNHALAAAWGLTARLSAGGGVSAISQPSAVGDSGASGYTENCGGLWMTVPYQMFTGIFTLALWADHQEGIDEVWFIANGGPARIISATSRPAAYAPPSWITDIVETFDKSPDDFEFAGKSVYSFNINAADYNDGTVTFQAIVYPTSGTPLVMPNLPIVANFSGTIPADSKYVDPVNGDDGNDGSEGSPFETVVAAAAALSNANHGTIYCKAGTHSYSGGTFPATSTGWLTLAEAPGVSRDDVVFTGFVWSDQPGTTNLRYLNVTLDGVSISSAGGSSRLWLDNCKATGAFNIEQEAFTGGTWQTNSYFHHTTPPGSGSFSLGNISINCVANNVVNDAYVTGHIINNWVNDLNPTEDPDLHTDIGQFGTSPTTNVCVYGLQTSGTIRAQAWTNEAPLNDIFFRDVDFSTITIDNNLMFKAAQRNVVFTNVKFGNTCYLLTETAIAYTAEKVVFDNCTPGVYSPALSTIEGVTER